MRGHFIFLYSLFAFTSAQESPFVCLDSTGTCYHGGWYPDPVTSFASFQGIRFAQPPVGNLRFMPPKALEDPSIGTVDVSGEAKIICVQDGGKSGEEDCLLLNVYVPGNVYNDTSDTKYPVMVWIYGGGFTQGDNTFSTYGPQPYMDKDLVLVTINYRLGPFGFLSLGNSGVFGNAGLMDQNLALQWVQENIGNFGGDRDSVTIFGESAGSLSVALQVLNPYFYFIISSNNIQTQ